MEFSQARLNHDEIEDEELGERCAATEAASADATMGNSSANMASLHWPL